MACSFLVRKQDFSHAGRELQHWVDIRPMTPRNNFVLVSNRLPNLFARRPEMTLPLIPSGHAKPSGSSVRHFFPFFGVVLDWALPLRAAQEIFPKCSFRRSADPALDSIYAFAMKLGSLATRVTLYRVSVAQHEVCLVSVEFCMKAMCF